MKKGNAEGPVVALILLMVAIIGLVVYVERDREHWYDGDEYEWQETAETPVSSEHYDDYGSFWNEESQQFESRQKSSKSRFIHDLEEHVKKMFDMETVE